MLSKAEIFDLVKSGLKPQGYSMKTGRDAYLSAAKTILGRGAEAIKDVNNVPQNGPKPGGGE